MLNADIVKKFRNEFIFLSLFKNETNNAKEFYDYLKREKILKYNTETKNKIVNYYNFLLEYNSKINNFLSNEKYAKFVRESNDIEIINSIHEMKNNLIDNGILIEGYLTIIKSQPSLFIKNFDGRVEKYGTYDRDINGQYKKATGRVNSENYSLCDFYQWVTNQKIIGENLVRQLSVIEKLYSLKFGEINKGLYDSLFISHEKWKLITPNTYTFSSLDQNNVIKGSLAYECGTEIKDDYKTFYVPSDINTIVLHNPYNQKELDTLLAVSDEMNVILSFFGNPNDCDVEDKMRICRESLNKLESNPDNDIICLSKVKKKQYIKTIVSIKK